MPGVKGEKTVCSLAECSMYSVSMGLKVRKKTAGSLAECSLYSGWMPVWMPGFRGEKKQIGLWQIAQCTVWHGVQGKIKHLALKRSIQCTVCACMHEEG